MNDPTKQSQSKRLTNLDEIRKGASDDWRIPCEHNIPPGDLFVYQVMQVGPVSKSKLKQLWFATPFETFWRITPSDESRPVLAIIDTCLLCLLTDEETLCVIAAWFERHKEAVESQLATLNAQVQERRAVLKVMIEEEQTRQKRVKAQEQKRRRDKKRGGPPGDQQDILRHLPGTVKDLMNAMSATEDSIKGKLKRMRKAGLVTTEAGVWKRVSP